MFFSFKKLLLISLFVICTGSFYAESFQLIYQYTDHAGKIIMAQQVPAEYVKYGYKVFDLNGNLVRDIPPSIPESEKEELRIEKERRRKHYVEIERLIRKFGNSENIRRARDRRVAEIQVNIDVQQGNIDRLRYEQKQIQEEAALLERQGRPVPEYMGNRIKDILAQIKESEDYIKSQEDHQKNVILRYSGWAETLEEVAIKNLK